MSPFQRPEKSVLKYTAKLSQISLRRRKFSYSYQFQRLTQLFSLEAIFVMFRSLNKIVYGHQRDNFVI